MIDWAIPIKLPGLTYAFCARVPQSACKSLDGVVKVHSKLKGRK